MNKKKWELLDQRFEKTIIRAMNKKGSLSLATIIESQYYFPRTYPLKLKVINSLALSPDKKK
ncbi:hypothetical protein [Photobacterium damselae]|uniref:hypothetical protein n=1 Tax=Photobacterium damselae TaxID=38293 RepID=UPI0030F3B840